MPWPPSCGASGGAGVFGAVGSCVGCVGSWVGCSVGWSVG